MFNITGNFATVFLQPEIRLNVSERMLFANLSTSKKNSDKESSSVIGDVNGDLV